MNNDPELNGKYLGIISTDFVKVADAIKEASYQIRIRGFSDFPIFPISRTEMPIGQLLIGKTEMHNQWNYYVTYIDEFIQRKLIKQDKVDEFKSVFKNPDEFCCLFVVDGDFSNFLFIPFPVD